MAGVALVYLGMLVGLAGLVCLVRPLPLLRVRNRKSAALVLLFGVAIWPAGAFLPAGAPKRVSTPRSLLDDFAPVYEFNEQHSLIIHASAAKIFEAIQNVRADEIRFFKTLIWIRYLGRPKMLQGVPSAEKTPLLTIATRTAFLELGEKPDEEIVIGTIVIRPPGGAVAHSLTPDQFKKLSAPGYVSAAMNYRVHVLGDDKCLLTTETRVHATSASACRQFAGYWRMIYPGSALIRRMWLRAIRNRAEN